jgi:hypothetical protein
VLLRLIRDIYTFAIRAIQRSNVAAYACFGIARLLTMVPVAAGNPIIYISNAYDILEINRLPMGYHFEY